MASEREEPQLDSWPDLGPKENHRGGEEEQPHSSTLFHLLQKGF